MTWDSLNDTIIGDLRLPLHIADRMTLNEIVIMNIGLQRERAEQLKNTRLLMWEIRTKYLKKGKRIKPEDIFKLHGEMIEVPILTNDEYNLIKKQCPTAN